MRVPDKFNPRLWLRDWLSCPSLSEKEERRAAEAAAAQMFIALERGARTKCTDVLAALLSPMQVASTEHRKQETTDRQAPSAEAPLGCSEGSP